MSVGGKSFHKKDWALLGAGLAALSAPWTVPALFGATGAAGVGAGAAGAAGATGAAAGAGGTLGGTAGIFGAAPTLGAGLLAPSATPMITALAPEAAVGGSSIFGAGTGANALNALGIMPNDSTQTIWQMLGKGSKNTLEAFDKAQKLQKMARGPEPLSPAPAGRPPQGGGGGGELAALMALMSNPVGQEQLKRLMRG